MECEPRVTSALFYHISAFDSSSLNPLNLSPLLKLVISFFR